MLYHLGNVLGTKVRLKYHSAWSSFYYMLPYGKNLLLQQHGTLIQSHHWFQYGRMQTCKLKVIILISLTFPHRRNKSCLIVKWFWLVNMYGGNTLPFPHTFVILGASIESPSHNSILSSQEMLKPS